MRGILSTFGYMGMNPAMFYDIVDRLSPRLTKTFQSATFSWTQNGCDIETFGHSLSYSFKIPYNTISNYARELCSY